MKKTIVCLALTAAFFSFIFLPNEMKATTNSAKTELMDKSASLKVSINKLNAEKSMDKLTLNPAKKEILRNEMDKGPGGIYISVGALIIIIILLIILL